jgi:hypothetical protein
MQLILGRHPPDWAIPLIPAINTIAKEIHQMNELLDTLTQRVAAIEDVGDSAILLLQDLKTSLDAAIATSDWTAVNDINQRLSAQTDELANAVATYTPAPSEPTDPAV